MAKNGKKNIIKLWFKQLKIKNSLLTFFNIFNIGLIKKNCLFAITKQQTMEHIFLFSIKSQLTKKNVCETYIKIIRHYSNKNNLNLKELDIFYNDLKLFNLFIVFNVEKQNINLYQEFFKNINKKRTLIKNLITNKIKKQNYEKN